MSYILEALKKAERERRLGQVPNLETRHDLILASRRRLWPWLIGAASLANASVLAFLFSLPSESPTIEPSATPPIPSEPKEAPAAPPPKREQSLADKPLGVKPPSSQDRKFESPAKTRTASSPELMEDAPPLRSLPAEFHRSVPGLNLDVHVYSKNAGNRFVLINSRRYQEGDQLQEGPLLEAITLKGVILSYKGRRFLLPVNS